MSVKKDAAGRRWVEVEVEVPGTPEEVWEAIATGPGVSSWFVPTEVEMGEDGTPTRVLSNFGPGMESVAKVTEWDPPRRFAADSEDLGPGAPPIATEWIVEARSGGVCVVRVVHSLFTSSEEWDDQVGSWESGWPGFFRILRLYLTHFRGQRGAAFQVMAMAPEPASEAWEALTTALGLAGAGVGERRSAPAGAPPLAGQVEVTGQNEHDLQLLLRTEEPAPGLAHLFAMPMGGQVFLSVRLYLYGDAAPAAVARAEPVWQEWLSTRFAPSAAS
jgi:uncharacterized protein YndB with AHSA1/START domain